MNDLPISFQYSITRSTFQNLLHQALVTDDDVCFGVLAAEPSTDHVVQQMALVNGDNAGAVISELENKGFVCVGLFHMMNHEVSASLKEAMKDVYIELSISLDEKGRLDLLACRHESANNVSDEITLVLIEDGQLEAYA